MNGGEWATQLYNHGMVVMYMYGDMPDAYWNQLRDWASNKFDELKKKDKEEAEKAKPKPEPEKPKKEIKVPDPTPDEIEKIQSEAYEKSMADMKIAYDRIIEKALFLTKLDIPKRFKRKD